MNDSEQNEGRPFAATEPRRVKWSTFLIFLVASALEMGVLAFGNLTFEKWSDWIIVGGALFFPVLTVISWIDLLNDWSVDKSDRIVLKVFGWIIGVPVVAGALLLVLWVLLSFFGWLATIPVWAAVIIILLLLRR